MDPDYGIPGLGTYTAPGWQGASEATYTPASAEAAAGARTPSQVPGTSGAPSDYTPSATPSGVNSGAGTNTPGTPSSGGFFGNLFGGAPQRGGGLTPQRGMRWRRWACTCSPRRRRRHNRVSKRRKPRIPEPRRVVGRSSAYRRRAKQPNADWA
jgi:hypothetical protein